MASNDGQDYDSDERAGLIERHDAVTSELDGMMQDAVHGESIDGQQLTSSTGEYLASMMADAESVLTVASEVGADTSLSHHCLQMALLGMAIGIEMGLDEANVRTIGVAGMLHDWGMIRIPEKLRSADRFLESEEMIPIKRHPTHSLEILQSVSGLPLDVPLICYQVHERPNGSGYPRGRNDSQIHLFAKILGVADAYVAMTSPRPYRPPMMPYSAMECLLTLASEKYFDAVVVRHLLHTVTLFPLHSLVTLSDGSVAQVIRRDGNNYQSPVVKRLTDGEGNPLTESDESVVVKLAESECQVVQALASPIRGEVGLNQELVSLAYR
jgi:HD-GYP domain-containing protein (c-di-GMP phosphodiesterase class II)